MLIPVTPPTQYVAEYAKCGFSGQANMTWGPSPKRYPQFNMAILVTLKHAYAQNARARIWTVYVIWLLHTEVVWHTNQSPHAIWCSPTRPHRDAVRWRLNIKYGPMRHSHIFLRIDQCLTHAQKLGIRTHTHLVTHRSLPSPWGRRSHVQGWPTACWVPSGHSDSWCSGQRSWYSATWPGCGWRQRPAETAPTQLVRRTNISLVGW